MEGGAALRGPLSRRIAAAARTDNAWGVVAVRGGHTSCAVPPGALDVASDLLDDGELPGVVAIAEVVG